MKRAVIVIFTSLIALASLCGCSEKSEPATTMEGSFDFEEPKTAETTATTTTMETVTTATTVQYTLPEPGPMVVRQAVLREKEEVQSGTVIRIEIKIFSS